MNEEQNEEVTNEEYETNTDTEGDVEEEAGSEDNGSDEPDLTTPEGRKAYEAGIRKDQDKRWKDRIKDSKKDTEKDSSENYQRLDLKTEGIKDKKEQDIVLDYIKEKSLLGEKVSVPEALGKMVIKEALTEIRSKNVPAPSTRTSGGANDSYEYYAKNIKAGKLRLTDVADGAMRQRLMKGKIF